MALDVTRANLIVRTLLVTCISVQCAMAWRSAAEEVPFWKAPRAAVLSVNKRTRRSVSLACQVCRATVIATASKMQI